MTEDFGALHPQAAQHRPYLDEMAAWRHMAQAEQGLMSGLAEIPYAPEGPPQTREEVIEEVYQDHLRSLEEPSEEISPPHLEEDEPPPPPAPQETPEDLFDPSENNAIRVLHHLKYASSAEVLRVMSVERRGKARKGILGQEEDLLTKARKREN